MPYKLFLPNKQKRSSVLSLKFLFLINLVLLILVVSRVLSISGKDLNILGFATNIHVSSLLAETNKQRILHNLQPLKSNSLLEKAAKSKAENMFMLNYWAHIAPNGKTPWKFINEAGYKYTYAGENLAKDFDSSANVVSAWMNSPTHRENILNSNYTEIGFAVVNGNLHGEETTLIVQIFGTPVGVLASDTNKINENAENDSIANKPEILNIDTENSYILNTESNKNYITVDVAYIRYAIFTFIIFFTFALIIDGIVAYRRNYKRLTGGTISHLFFLTFSILLFIYFFKGGIL